MRTNASSRRLQRLYDTGNYTCYHRRYGHPNAKFYPSVGGLPISYPYLEVKLKRKI